MPRCWNAKLCLSYPSYLSKASQKHFSWCVFLPPSRSWNHFNGVLIYGTYTLVIGRMVQLWGKTAQKFLYSLCCPNQRQLWALLMLWVAGWYPTNCCSSDLSDNFCRNPVQQKRAGRVWGSALPHPRGMQCRCCTVMVPLEIYSPVRRPRNDISLGAF